MPVVDERWGTYTLVRSLGKGTFAEVWEVRHAALGSRHALKILDAQWAGNASIRARFLAEGRILAQIRHPNLVAVTDLVDDGPGRLGLVMDLVDGPSLGHRIATDGRFAPHLAVVIARGIAAGLHRVHEAGIVHRDLKPENVLLVTDGDVTKPVVVDFGVAKILDAADVQVPRHLATRVTTRLGTPQYMAPEQAEASHAVDRRADVFALGTVLYEMLAGHPAFEGATIAEVLYRSGRGERRPLEGIDAAIVEVVDHALAIDPDDRYPSMTELEDALDGLPAASPSAVPPRPPAVVEVRRAAPARSAPPGALRAAAVVLATLGLGAVAWVLLDPSGDIGASAGEGSTAEAASPAEPRTAADVPGEGVPAARTAADAPPPPSAAPTSPRNDPTKPEAGEVASDVPSPGGGRPRPDAARAPAPGTAPRSPPVGADRDAAAVDAAWGRLARPLASCAPTGTPSQRWKIAVQIGANGRPTSVRASSTRDAPKVATCLESAARGLDAGPLAAATSRVFSLSLP